MLSESQQPCSVVIVFTATEGQGDSEELASIVIDVDESICKGIRDALVAILEDSNAISVNSVNQIVCIFFCITVS